MKLSRRGKSARRGKHTKRAGKHLRYKGKKVRASKRYHRGHKRTYKRGRRFQRGGVKGDSVVIAETELNLLYKKEGSLLPIPNDFKIIIDYFPPINISIRLWRKKDNRYIGQIMKPETEIIDFLKGSNNFTFTAEDDSVYDFNYSKNSNALEYIDGKINEYLVSNGSVELPRKKKDVTTTD